MANVTKKLVMTFQDDTGKNASLSVDNPRADLTKQDIKTVMDLIVAKNIFEPTGYGADLAKLVDAKIVKTDTTEYDLI